MADQDRASKIHVSKNHKDKCLQARHKRKQDKRWKRSVRRKSKYDQKEQIVALDVTEKSERKRYDARQMRNDLDDKHYRSQPFVWSHEVSKILNDAVYADAFVVVKHENHER